MRDDADVTDDWENRILCRDESCIGVIGSDGRCKECGKPYEGSDPLAGKRMPDQTPAGDADPTDESKGERPVTVTADPVDDDADEWERRALCPDEACIGVIGPDGRCKECGRRFDR